ncbi:MAG: hypothetical protein KGH71_04920 [Candidatus Micrarchaeota archaeon]|nr:hypothetical protein [Candidatus Micrarchaeota archaeon]
MNYYAYARRRLTDIGCVKFKLQRLFSFLSNSDYERLQALLAECEAVLKKYY